MQDVTRQQHRSLRLAMQELNERLKIELPAGVYANILNVLSLFRQMRLSEEDAENHVVAILSDYTALCTRFKKAMQLAHIIWLQDLLDERHCLEQDFDVSDVHSACKRCDA